jgi:hypothetical protein
LIKWFWKMIHGLAERNLTLMQLNKPNSQQKGEDNLIINFLTSLYQYLNENHYLYLWTLSGRKTYLFSASGLAEMSNIVSQLVGDVYFGVGATGKRLTEYERPKNEDITAIPGLWVDIDVYNPQSHKSNALPPDLAAAMSLLPDIHPSMVVWSGYGIHVYWLFKEPWEIETPEERKQATELLQALQAVVKYNASLKGWKIDTTSDLSRVLRLPGTHNYKIPETPVLCQIIEQSEIRYNPDDIEDMLPPVPEPVRTGTERKTAFERRATDGQAELMLRNCIFMQHCQLNAVSINYSEWLAMLTNIVRASDGIEAAHRVSALDTARYKPEDTDKKIDEALQAMNPQTCDYIRSVIGFRGCPPNGCGVQAPCGWSLSRVAQARATVKNIPAPAPETVLVSAVLDALAILKKEDPPEYIKFKAACKGRINLNDLEKMVNQQGKRKPDLHVVQPGEKPGTRMLRDTVPELPIDLALPANFKFERSGILFIKTNSNDDTMVYKVAGCPVIITERVFNMDTETEKLEICFRYLKGWRRVLLPRSTVFDSRRIMHLADFGVPISSESSKFMVKWLDALADTNQDKIPIMYAVSKLGWRGECEFILPNFSQKYRIDIDDDGSQSTVAGFSTAGERLEWISRMQYLRQSPKARFILAASFAAPLLKILGQRNFIIHNWGNSQDGKTATLWAAMSVWGNPDKLIGTFDATSTAMERRAALYSDLPLAINEREVLAQNKRYDISPLLYVMGEGRGRGRGTKTGLQGMATWRTIVMSTGEGTLSTTGSFDGVMTRVLEISDGPLAHDRDFARQLYHFLPRCHGHAGPEFLRQLLVGDLKIIRDTYKQFQADFRHWFQDKVDSHIDAVACVVVADYLASAWTFGETWELARAGAIATGQHVLSGLVARSEASESGRAWNMFVDWLAENRDRFSSTTQGPKYGYYHSDKQNPKALNLYVIRSVLEKFLSDSFSSSRKIIREWAQENKIETFYRGGKMRYDTMGKAMDGGIRPQVLKLKSFESENGQDEPT